MLSVMEAELVIMTACGLGLLYALYNIIQLRRVDIRGQVNHMSMK